MDAGLAGVLATEAVETQDTCSVLATDAAEIQDKGSVRSQQSMMSLRPRFLRDPTLLECTACG